MAQGVVAASASARRRPAHGRALRRALLGALLFVVLLVLVAGAGIWMVLRGPVSADGLRAEVERQLSDWAGDGRDVRLQSAQFTFGRGGLVTVQARGVALMEGERRTIGRAREVGVVVEAWPLLRGEVRARRLEMRGVAVALGSFLPKEGASVPSIGWTDRMDFAEPLRAMAGLLNGAERAVRAAGLQRVRVADVVLADFERVGITAQAARLEDLDLRTQEQFVDGLFFDGRLRTPGKSVEFTGSWRRPGKEQRLDAQLRGVALEDVAAVVRPQTEARFGSLLDINLRTSFDANGEPGDAVLGVLAGPGAIDLSGDGTSAAALRGAELNLRLMTARNQLELEPSAVLFEGFSASLLGGVRWPRPGETDAPRFELIANDVPAPGLVAEGDPRTASLVVGGTLDTVRRGIDLESLRVVVDKGELSGKGRVSLGEARSRIALELTSSADLPVGSVKAYWPELIAPYTRNWIRTGIRGGTVRKSSLTIDTTIDRLLKRARLDREELALSIEVDGSAVHYSNEMPPIEDARGTVRYGGQRLQVALDRGRLDTGRQGDVQLRNGTLLMPDTSAAALPSDVRFDLSGPLAALAKLGQAKPLDFTRAIGIAPERVKGTASGRIEGRLLLGSTNGTRARDWKASLKVANASSADPLAGRKVADADLTVVATPNGATITGTAQVDGVPAKLALKERYGSTRGQAPQRKVTMTLSDKQRASMGMDTGAILSGPVAATITQEGTVQSIELDLRKARLSLPWVGWQKGKGIPAKASLRLRREGKTTKITRLSLRGEGIRADGSMTLQGGGLQAASFKKVRLNKKDNFDVAVRRTKGGFDVRLDARRYDGRAIIRSFLEGEGDATSRAGGDIRVQASVGTLRGFGGESLRRVDIDFRRRKGATTNVAVRGTTASGQSAAFSLAPGKRGKVTTIRTGDAGAMLRFLDIYSKVLGGTLSAQLVQDARGVYRGPVNAENFTLLGEPRLAALLAKPTAPPTIERGEEIVRAVQAKASPDAKVDQFRADIERGRSFLKLERGRIQGGDASVAFDGTVYDRRNRMNITGTFLPGRSLNRLVSKIPLIGLALGRGKVNGLVGITFRLRGSYRNPRIQVNPLSIIAPGVFRQLFKW